MAIHVGIVATMFARYPKSIDFSCGFQSYLPSGTCSKAWRERSTSLFNSARKNSVSFMCVSLLHDVCGHHTAEKANWGKVERPKARKNIRRLPDKEGRRQNAAGLILAFARRVIRVSVLSA